MQQPSDRYFEALRLTRGHHDRQNKTFSGQFTWKQRKRIKPLIDQYGCETMLDYGCGKAKQYDASINRDEEGRSLVEFFGMMPTLYDPGVRAYSAEPVGKFDIVICVQVLASIPRDDLPWVIDRLYQFAGKAIFVAERIKAPNKPIYRSIAGEMPRDLDAGDWLDLLRRPGSPVHLRTAFKLPDAKWDVRDFAPGAGGTLP